VQTMPWEMEGVPTMESGCGHGGASPFDDFCPGNSQLPSAVVHSRRAGHDDSGGAAADGDEPT
jgi:hypothetical protein